VNRVNTNVNRVNTTVNRVNTNVNRVNTNANRVNTNVKRSKMTLPTGGLFMRGAQPKFLGGTTSAVKQPTEKKGFFASLFGKKENKNFINSNKFKGSKQGYVFRTGEKGTGYYKNTGVIQGPQLPPTNITQPIPTNENFALELASAKIKQLGLKRENKFLNMLKVGTKKRKDVVLEAEKAKEAETQFLSFLDTLNISNTNRNSFKQRMATDEFNQLRVEAQLKADDKANVVRTNEQKMNMFLKTTSLGNVNKTLFLNRARAEGSNINTLIEEARKLNSDVKGQKLTNKQEQFRNILQNYNKLNGTDKEALIKEVSVNTNANSMRQMADDLVKKRMEEKKNATAQNLLSFLTPLGINQKNKEEFLRRFRNENVNINSIKAEALKLQESKGSANIENLRAKLNTRLGELGLNQISQNAIMKKFTNGNRNVNKLIQEAKNLKSTRNTENMNTKMKEYITYLNTLPGLTNDDKKILMKNMNRNKAASLSNQKVAAQKQNEKNQFEKFLVNLGLNNGDRGTMMNKYNSNSLTMNALQKVAQELKNVRVQEQKAANKRTLMKYLETANIPKNTKINIEKRFNTNEANLKSLQNEVNKIIKNAQNSKLTNNKSKLASNVKGSILSNTNKNAFIRRLNAENVNIIGLRSELNTMIKQMVESQRAKDRDELEQYMKTQGLSLENQKIVLNKFNVNNNVALVNLKEEANAILVSRIQQKRNTNMRLLTNRGRQLGLTNEEINNLAKKLNSEKLEPLMNEAGAIAKKKKQIKKNEIERAKSDYINKLGLNANNKRNIMAQNLNFNATKKLANQRLQTKIAEKRAKNITKLKLHLNTLNLNNEEKRKFYNNFNKNVNLNTIIKNATNLNSQKKSSRKAGKLAEFKKFLNEQGLNAGEQQLFINKLNKNQEKVAALKVEAKKFANQKFAILKAQKREELVKILGGLSNLTRDNINGILRNFDSSNVNVNVLSKRAAEINKSRKNGKYAKDKEEFYKYLNTLKNLTAENKTEITSKLDDYFTNWNSIKQLATNKAIKRSNERRQLEKDDLNKYMTNMGFNNDSKRTFFKRLDDGENLSTVKNIATLYKKDFNAKRKATARKGFSNLLNTLYINKSDRDALLEQFNDDTTGLNQLQNNAREREAKTIERNRGTLTLYLADELKLNAPDVNLLLKNYNADPRSLNTLRNRGRQLKNARNEEERVEVRRQIKEYLNGLNLLNNKNKQNIIKKNLPYKNAKAEGNKAQEFKRVAKRGAERNILTNAIKNLPNSDQTVLLNKFNTRNVTLNSMLNEAKDLKVMRIAEKRARERTELYNTLNGLNMNVVDRDTIMNKFNKSNASVNALKNEAVKLRNTRIAQKRSQNRSELETILDGTNLNVSNKTRILNMFNANKNATLTSLRVTIDELSKKRKVEKRLATRVEVDNYLKKIGLSNADTKTVLNRFNANGTISLQNARNEANALLIKRVSEKMAQNRESLVEHMNDLNISNTNRAAILKNFDSEAATLNNLKSRATNINAAVKAKAAQRQELSNYMNNLGINGKNILNKFNSGRSTLDKLKKEALKMKALSNAKAVNAKKDDLRGYLKETRLPNTNKQSFLNRVEVNTDMNSIKREIRELNKVLKSRNDEIAQKKTELSTYLNTLNDLTPKQRSGLIRKIVNANTNIQSLKNEGNRLNKNVKNRRNEQNRLDEEKRRKAEEAQKLKDEKRLESHLRGLKHLTSKEMEEYMSDLKDGKALLADLIAVSKARNSENEKDKDVVRNYVRKSTIPQSKKDVYLKQLSTPHVNITPIKGLVNANVEAQKVAAETKLKRLTNLTTDERANFKNRLQIEPVEGVLKEAEKLNSNRKTARKNKNKTTKNVAKALQGLTTLTRENRKSFMNKLPQNGQEKVISNAVALNIQRKKNMANEERKKKLGENTKAFDTKLRSLRNLTDEERAKYMNNFKMAPSTADVIMKRAIERNARVRGLRTGKEQNMKNLSTQLQKFTNLTKNNRRKYIERLKTEDKRNILMEANAENVRRKTEKQKVLNDEIAKRKAEEAAKKNRNLQTKTVAKTLQGLTSLERENRKKFMNRLATNGANKVVSSAKALNAERKAEQAAKKKKEEMERQMIEDKKKAEEAKKKNRNLQTKTVAKTLQGLTSLERENRKKFMNRLATNGANKVVSSAKALNAERKAEQAAKKKKEEMERQMIEDKKKAEDAKKKMEEAKKRSQNLQTKRIAKTLQGLTSLERENRKKFMNRLATNGANKVVSSAKALNAERKAEQAAKKKKEEMERQMIEDKKKAEEAAKKNRNLQIKRVAAKLQGLTSLERENRKKFMNRLATNGDQKVLANAMALNKDRKKIREGVEWKLKQLGAKGSNLQAFMKRWNNSKNKTIFDNARKKVINKQPLLNKVVREIPGTFGQWRRGWEDAIRKAETPQEIERLDRLLDEKSKLRTEIEKAPIADDKRKGQLRFVMQMRNDIGKRRMELARDIKTKKEMGDAATKQAAQKLQSMDKLSRDNRKRFMDRVAKGEDTRTVLTNADKLQRNRLAAERVKQQKAEEEKKVLEEKKRKDQEKAKQAKLRGDTAKMLQGMSGLERKNRQEFMQRLERGNDPAKVISNARTRDQMKRTPTNRSTTGKSLKQKEANNIRKRREAQERQRAASKSRDKSFTFNKRPSGQVKTMTAAQRFGTTGKYLKQKEANNIRKRREAQQRQRAKRR
jgi:hypothetical protein